MKDKALQKEVTGILISAVVTAGIWVGFEVYRAYTKAKIPQGLEKYLEVLDPRIDTDLLNGLKERER